MFKVLILSLALAVSACAIGQHQDKDTVSHAVNHAGHWLSHHVNAPHKHLRKRRRRRHHHYKKDTVSHAVNHAGNWISHHVNAPHH
jgi:hypothetical protein